MDMKCPGGYKIPMVFGYAQTAVLCVGCPTVLSAYRRKSKAGQEAGQEAGPKMLLSRRKQHSKHLVQDELELPQETHFC
ncbi:40S ribosomal protein S27-like [Lemmus lemmus]